MSVPHARPAADPVVRIDDARGVDGALAALAAGGVAVVCVGPRVDDPLGVAHRVVAADPDVAVLILTDLAAAVEIDRQRELSPSVEADILLYTGEDVDAAQAAAAARTRARRDQRTSPVRGGLPAPSDGRHLGRVLDQAPIAIVTLERSGAVRGWNERAEALFGEASPGQPFDALFPEETREALREHLAASAADGGHTAVFERVAADGARQVLEVAGGSLGPESGDAMMVLVQDVTARVAAERRHRQTEDLLSAVVDSVPDGVFVKSRESRYLLINRPGAAIWGRTPEEIVGRPIEDVVHPDAYERILANDRAVLASGRAQTFDEESPGPPRRWYSSTKAPFYDHEGRIAGLVGISRDVTRRRLRETRALQFDEATRAMTDTLDPALGADRLADVVARELADLCVVAVADHLGHPAHVARASAAAPADASLLDALEALVPAGLTARGPRVVDRPHERIPSALVLPLPGAAATIGTLILGATDAPLDAETRETADELARRAGSALENARLHVERTRIATTLQRSLLPPRLPSIPGMSLAVRFRASGAGVEVGGDFYDVFPHGDGWAVAIGDVCGKGPEAAAVTALARYTIRALALRDDRPELILRGLNDALLTQRGGRDFCTATLLRLEGPRLTVAGGGHPPPLLLRADGSGEELGGSGTLLGVLPAPALPVREALLAPGDTVVLYTDGLNEANAPEQVYTPEDLLDAIRPAAGHNADEIAARLAELVPSAAEPRDDIAIVVLAFERG